jgi:hypothetical protein
MGIVLADYADRVDAGDHGFGSGCRQTRVRCHDEMKKIDIAAIEAARRG